MLPGGGQGALGGVADVALGGAGAGPGQVRVEGDGLGLLARSQEGFGQGHAGIGLVDAFPALMGIGGLQQGIGGGRIGDAGNAPRGSDADVGILVAQGLLERVGGLRAPQDGEFRDEAQAPPALDPGQRGQELLGKKGSWNLFSSGNRRAQSLNRPGRRPGIVIRAGPRPVQHATSTSPPHLAPGEYTGGIRGIRDASEWHEVNT